MKAILAYHGIHVRETVDTIGSLKVWLPYVAAAWCVKTALEALLARDWRNGFVNSKGLRHYPELLSVITFRPSLPVFGSPKKWNGIEMGTPHSWAAIFLTSMKAVQSLVCTLLCCWSAPEITSSFAIGYHPYSVHGHVAQAIPYSLAVTVELKQKLRFVTETTAAPPFQSRECELKR